MALKWLRMISVSLRAAQKTLSFSPELKCTNTNKHTHTHTMTRSMPTSYDYFVHSGQESTLGMPLKLAVLYPQICLYWSVKPFRMLLSDNSSRRLEGSYRLHPQNAAGPVFQKYHRQKLKSCIALYPSKKIVSFFRLAVQLPVGQGLLIHEVSRSHNDTPQSIRLLWTSDQLVAEISTWQHTALKKETSMPPVAFERTISAGERSHSYALNSAATGLAKYLGTVN